MLNTLYNKRCCAYASQGSRHNTFFQKERVFMKSKKKINNRDITLFLFVIPAVVLYCMFFIYPIINGLYYSMTDWNGITKKFHFIGLGNYLSIVQDARFRGSFLFTLVYALMLLALVLVISMVLALLLNSRIKYKSAFRAIYFFPAVISMLTAGLIFNEFFYRVLPGIGGLFNIEVLKTSILSNPSLAKYGILFVHVWQSVAIPTVLLMAGLQSIPQELIESASLDGANKWQLFKHITLPFVLPVVTVVVVLMFKDGLMLFDYVVGLTQGGPAGATESVALLIYNHGFKEMKFSYGIAESIILCIQVCTISFIQIAVNNKKKVY